MIANGFQNDLWLTSFSLNQLQQFHHLIHYKSITLAASRLSLYELQQFHHLIHYKSIALATSRLSLYDS